MVEPSGFLITRRCTVWADAAATRARTMNWNEKRAQSGSDKVRGFGDFVGMEDGSDYFFCYKQTKLPRNGRGEIFTATKTTKNVLSQQRQCSLKNSFPFHALINAVQPASKAPESPTFLQSLKQSGKQDGGDPASFYDTPAIYGTSLIAQSLALTVFPQELLLPYLTCCNKGVPCFTNSARMTTIGCGRNNT